MVFPFCSCIIGSAEALPILCARCARWEREMQRERVRRKWPHLSSTEIGAEFCTFPCQKFAPWRRVLHFILPKICTLVSPLLKGAEFTLSVAKNVSLFETVRILRFASVKWHDRGSKRETNNRISGCTVLLIEEMNENLQIEKHKSGRRSFRTPDWFVLFDLQIFSGGVYPPSTTSRAIFLSISNSFWY